jgi:uncharacterized membrane protein YfhO
VDGGPARVVKTDHSLIGVVVPAGGKDVALSFASPAYRRGKMATLFFLLLAAGMIFVLPRLGSGKQSHA